VPLIYVTGISGAGKSAVYDELKARGYQAYDGDLDGFKSWYERSTGRHIQDQRRWADTTVEWRRHYWLKIDPEKVAALAADAGTREAPVFLCGTSAGEDAVWHLFDKVVQLSITERTLRYRIAMRTNSDFGKEPSDLEDILGWHESLDERMQSFGAIIVDAEQPLDAVVDDVLRVALSA
jgi:hypothetical protein